MSNNPEVLINTDLPLPIFIKGKVRDTYMLHDMLLIIASDRISAFDFVLPGGIPDKGRVLTQISAFWFKKTEHIIPNHMIEMVNDTSSLYGYFPAASCCDFPEYLVGRSMIVKRVKRIPVECVVRGYISGSAWAEYKNQGTVNGVTIPKRLKESQELPEPIFTPTTKEEAHDRPIGQSEMEMMVGKSLSAELKEKTLAVYRYAREYALTKGIILADTKMEFGLDDGKLILIDELLTPDSSRFWDTELYKVGQPQPSYDKQPVRDWLAKSGWNKKPPAPALPPAVIEATTRRYRKAYERLTGEALP